MVALNDTSFEKMDDVLHFDPLSKAEVITGKSYKEDEPTSGLGMVLCMMNADHKRRLLDGQDDAHFGTSLKDYCRMLKDLGFKLIYTEPFKSIPFNEKDPVKNEVFSIAWHPTKAILCNFESYDEERLNTSHWYFAFKPLSMDDFYKNGFHMSYSWFGFNEDNPKDQSKMVCMANWDAREAIRYQMKKLDNFGTFVSPWPKAHFLQLNTYADWKHCENHDYSYASNESTRRFNLLPEDIKTIIGGTVRGE